MILPCSYIRTSKEKGRTHISHDAKSHTINHDNGRPPVLSYTPIPQETNWSSQGIPLLTIIHTSGLKAGSITISCRVLLESSRPTGKGKVKLVTRYNQPNHWLKTHLRHPMWSLCLCRKAHAVRQTTFIVVSLVPRLISPGFYRLQYGYEAKCS